MEDLYMGKDRISNSLQICEKLFNELENINTVLLMTKTFCMEKEFNRQYYGISEESVLQLSEERNNYINMLVILSEKINTARNLNLSLERELRLHNDTDYCS